MSVPSDAADPVRDAVLEAARSLLEREGPDAVTNRRVARQAGCTTMAIYSRFGSKGGILDALYLEGVDRLAQAQATVARSESGVEEVLELCLAYRSVGLEAPGHYRVLFGDIPGWRPEPPLRQRLMLTFERLRDAVTRAVEHGAVQGEPTAIAFAVFATCHGYLALHHAAYTQLLPDPHAAYVGAVVRMLGGPPPDADDD